jgi:hypothetical protein
VENVSYKVPCEQCGVQFKKGDEIKDTSDGYVHEDCLLDFIYEQYSVVSLSFEEMQEEIRELNARAGANFLRGR